MALRPAPARAASVGNHRASTVISALAVAVALLAGWAGAAPAQAGSPASQSATAATATGSAAGANIVYVARDRVTGRATAAASLENGRKAGYVAPPVSIPAVSGTRSVRSASSLAERYVAPSALDLRALGRISPVRNQGRYGTCWAFAALGSLESAMLPGGSWDFSENNLAAHSGFDLPFDGGGNNRMATAYLARWDGPVLEADDRYGRPTASPNDLPERLHVREVLYLPPRTGPADNDDLKWAVATFGAVDASMYWDASCFNRGTAAYYSQANGLNHDVTCVGWDDSFPADRFSVRPPGDGAFLVRNSWGARFGNGGYFWISYHDSVFATDAAVFSQATTTGDYSAVYGHDDLGWIDSTGFSSSRGSAWFAAGHTAASSGSLAAVAFYTPVPNSKYEVYAGSSLDQLGSEPLAVGTIAMPGYHTVDLARQTPLAAGAGFVVAVKLTTPGCSWPVAIERSYQGYSSARTAPGQSFVSPDGRAWTDLGAAATPADVCLKAFTVGEAPGATPPTAVVDGFRGRRGGKIRITFHVAHATHVPTKARVSLTVVAGNGRVLERIVVRNVRCDAGRTVVCRTKLRSSNYRVIASATDSEGHRQASSLSSKVRVAAAGK